MNGLTLKAPQKAEEQQNSNQPPKESPKENLPARLM
jgi:hypothetical protein